MQQDLVLTSGRKVLAVASTWVRAGAPSRVITLQARAGVLTPEARLKEA